MIKDLRNTFFSRDLDIKEQLLHLLAISGIAAGIAEALITIISGRGMLILTVILIYTSVVVIFLQVARKKKCYLLCSRTAVVVVFMIAFPVLFFNVGGYKGGMPNYFVLALVFTACLLEKPERNPALIIEGIIYTACFLIAHHYPEAITQIAKETDIYIEIHTSTAITGIILTVVAIFAIRIYSEKHTQAENLNKQLIERNEALARYDRMKSEFLSMVAHEISTPMTTIMASGRDTLDLLKEPPLDVEEIAENQRRIEKKVLLIDGIITDLMDVTAIENGRLSLKQHPLHLPELLRLSSDAHFKHQDLNNNKISFVFQPGLPKVHADPVRIEQVLLNLLSNADRHTRDDTIEVKLESAGGGMQVVSVTDHGEGMDEDTKSTAFDQNVSSKEMYWRHGIGLHVCRLIVTAHGGEIWIDSEKGCGTSVSFSLREENP